MREAASMARKKRSIEQYQHDKEERLNNPPAGLGRLDTEPTTTAAYDRRPEAARRKAQRKVTVP
jgi:hypothetical protein